MKWPLLVVGLAACAPVPPMDAPATDGTCSVDRVTEVVGRPYSADLAERARTQSGSKAVRVIRPGMAVTMDYRVDRLNVDLDEKDVVTALRCG